MLRFAERAENSGQDSDSGSLDILAMGWAQTLAARLRCDFEYLNGRNKRNPSTEKPQNSFSNTYRIQYLKPFPRLGWVTKSELLGSKGSIPAEAGRNAIDEECSWRWERS